MRTLKQALWLIPLFLFSLELSGNSNNVPDCENKLNQLAPSEKLTQSPTSFSPDSTLKYQISLLPDSKKNLGRLEQYLIQPLASTPTTKNPIQSTLDLAKTNLDPRAFASFSDWLLGQFQEDPVVTFEDHYLGRQKQAYPAGPTRYNKNGERPFDGYLASRRLVDSMPLQEISLSDISKIHKEMMSRESYRDESGKIFSADKTFPKNSQNLKDSELGLFRAEGVSFETDRKHIPSNFLAIAKPISVATGKNPLLLQQNSDHSKIAYAPLSKWKTYSELFHFSEPLTEKLQQLSTKFTPTELDSNQNPEINQIRQQMIKEMTESAWKKAKEDIGHAKTTEEAIRIAAQFQRDFISIHPFYDGNGRVARLLTEKLLNSRGLPSPTYPHWGEDVSLTQNEIEAHLARSIFMSDNYLQELNKSLSSGKGYEEVLNPAVKSRILELLGDPTGDFDSVKFLHWLQDNRDGFQELSDAVTSFSKQSPNPLVDTNRLSPQEFSALSTLPSRANLDALAEEFLLWRKEKKGASSNFAEEKTQFAQWLDRHTYEDRSGSIRLASPEFQRTFAKLSENEAQYQKKMNHYYGASQIYRGVPSDRYLSDAEFVKLFTEQTALTTGNGVYPHAENVLPVFQRFNLSFLRDEMKLIKQVEGHAGGEDSREQYDMSGMVSFTSNPAIAKNYQFSQNSQLGLLFTAKKRLVGSISTYKNTPSMDYTGWLSEKEEALIGGVDPESFLTIKMQELGQKGAKDSYTKRTKTGQRLSYNKIQITETLLDESGITKSQITSVWEIKPGGSVIQIK